MIINYPNYYDQYQVISLSDHLDWHGKEQLSAEHIISLLYDEHITISTMIKDEHITISSLTAY